MSQLNVIQDVFTVVKTFLFSSRSSFSTSQDVSHNFGFWGPVDSTVDWCESNYNVTFYIAEFYNTISAIPMVLWAIFGIYLCRTNGVKEKRFTISFLALLGIGLGSTLFHATLRYYAQLLDELPMVLYSYFDLYIALETFHVRPRKRTIFFVFGLAILNAILYLSFEWYIIFVFPFVFVIFAQLCIVFNYVIHHYNDFSIYFYGFLFTMSLFLICGILWSIENTFCNYVKGFNFHAMWHLGGGFGLYSWNLLLILIRGNFLKKNAQLKYKGALLTHYVKWYDV